MARLNRVTAFPSRPSNPTPSLFHRIILGNIFFWLFWLCHLSFAVVVYFYLQDKPFRIGARSLGKSFRPLYQADISALISLAQGIIKFCFSTWCGVVAWRIIYILLSTRGLNLPELQDIASGLPPRLSWKSKRHRTTSLFLFCFIFVSLVTQYLSAPFFAASIAWNPIIIHGAVSENLTLPVAGEGDGWSNYNMFNEGRDILLQRSLASASGSPFSPDGKSIVMRRIIHDAVAANISINSTVVGLPVPFIIVDELSWVPDPSKTLNKTLVDAITTEDNPLFGVIEPLTNPLRRTTVGVMAVLPDRNKPWNESRPAVRPGLKSSTGLHLYEFPERSALVGQRYAAVMVERVQGEAAQDGCPLTSGAFGTLPPGIKLLSMTWAMPGDKKPNARNCYAIAKIKLRAGSLRCTDCNVVLPGTAEATIPTNATFLEADLADGLVLPVLDMMTEVMVRMAGINGTQIPYWNNLDDYVRGMIMLSYQTTWNHMTDRVRSPTITSEAHVLPPEYMIAIKVETQWFFVWIAITYAGIIAGCVFICISNMHHKAAALVEDPALAAIRLDPCRIDDAMPGLCSSSATQLSKAEKELRIRFSARAGDIINTAGTGSRHDGDDDSKRRHDERISKAWDCQALEVADRDDYGDDDHVILLGDYPAFRRDG
ncbi:hypothetical protein QBC44DRAFT_404912 [Cladorrhinum sp. PSN332]|nr:hypothetical protein QBC44DRAFT_404912 [Cladorrhinum sp. PSN332]